MFHHNETILLNKRTFLLQQLSGFPSIMQTYKKLLFQLDTHFIFVIYLETYVPLINDVFVFDVKISLSPMKFLAWHRKC